MNITFLGTASCFPTSVRGVSCLALQLKDGQVWLFDCGEASQIQLQKSSIKIGKISKIFITHLHGDHVFGLPGLLCSLGNRGEECVKTKTLDIYGPLGLRKYITSSLELTRSSLHYKYSIHELIPKAHQYPKDWKEWPVDHEQLYTNPFENNTSKIKANDSGYWPLISHRESDYEVQAGAIAHRIPTFGFVIQEKDSVGTLNTQKLATMGVTSGPLFGKIKNNIPITLENGQVLTPSDFLGPSKRGCKIVILGDTKDPSEIANLASNADVLVHEATMENANIDKALEFGHSTPEMAAAFAVSINASMLILNHVSSRYLPISNEEIHHHKNEISAEILCNEANAYLKDKQKYPIPVIVAKDFLNVPILRSTE